MVIKIKSTALKNEMGTARVLASSGPSMLDNGRLRFHLGRIYLSRPVEIKSEPSITKHGWPGWANTRDSRVPVLRYVGCFIRFLPNLSYPQMPKSK